LQTNF